MVRFASLLVVAVVLAASGCTTLGTTTLGSWGADKAIDDAAAASFPPPATVAIEFHPSGGAVKTKDIPLEEGMTVQDALKKTGAGNKYRRSFIDLQRTPKGGLPHKMVIDHQGGQVGHTTNYDLHPNDRIIITQDSSTILDDVFARFSPGGKKKRR